MTPIESKTQGQADASAAATADAQAAMTDLACALMQATLDVLEAKKHQAGCKVVFDYSWSDINPAIALAEAAGWTVNSNGVTPDGASRVYTLS